MTTPIRTQKVKETCRHPLTTEQLLDAGKQLAETQNEVGRLEDDFKSVRDDWKAKISAAEARLTTLSGRISRGYDMKETSCTVTMDTPEDGLKTCTRDDTGEKVWVREMTEQDKQLTLPLPEAADTAEENGTTPAAAQDVAEVITQNIRELAEKSNIAPAMVLKALVAINGGVTSIAGLQGALRIGYTAAAKLWAVCQEAGAPAPEAADKVQPGDEDEDLNADAGEEGGEERAEY